MNDDNMIKDIIQWQRIGCIVVRLSERLDVSPEDAFDIFYESDTCQRFHDPGTGLYLYGDLYIVDEVMRELQDKQDRKKHADVFPETFACFQKKTYMFFPLRSPPSFSLDAFPALFRRNRLGGNSLFTP